MKNVKIKTWRDLQKVLNKIPEKYLDTPACIFPFYNEELENIDSLNFVGNSSIDKECEDFVIQKIEKGFPYLVCQTPTKDWHSKVYKSC